MELSTKTTPWTEGLTFRKAPTSRMIEATYNRKTITLAVISDDPTGDRHPESDELAARANAAPELYEALEWIASQVEAYDRGVVRSAALNAAAEEASAALAKARGGE